MPTSRSVAQDEGYHYLIEIWPTVHHRQVGGESLRGATGTCTRSGEVVTMDGRTFPPVLDPTLTFTRYFSTAVPAIAVRLLWDRDTQDPGDLDLRDAVGDLWLVDESGGSSVGARTLLISGRVTSYTWGDEWEHIDLSLSGMQLQDRGDWYPPGAELTSDRFPDIANSGERDRAPACEGLLPPLVWAPVGSQTRVPAYVVRDEINAVSGASDLVYRRLLMGYRKPTNTSVDEQFAMIDPDRDGGWIDSTNSTEQRAAPASDVDDEGDTFWYVVADFVFTVGSSSLTITNGSADATISKSRRLAREGCQIKGSTGGLDDYVVIESADGTDLELSTTYGGATVTNGSGNVIPLPGDSADSVYWIPALGGCDRGDGAPITIATEVLIDWLRLCDFPGIEVAYGDLEVLTSRLSQVTISYTRLERGSPWAKCLEVLSYLPIRVYLAEGRLRFRWVGPPEPGDVVATMDITDAGSGLWRAEPFKWADTVPSPLIDLRCHWDAYKEIYRGTLSITGDSAIGRAQRAVQETTGPGRMRVELDTIESLAGLPRLVGLWLLYLNGHPRRVTEVEADATWRWLELGDVVSVASVLYRVDAIGGDAVGRWTIMLEECPV